MTLLDRYIIGKFLSTFFFILAMLMVIAVVFDAAEKIDDFIKFNAPLHAIVFDYYVNFVFFYSNAFSSLIIFLSVIFFNSKMARNNEIIAVLSSGVSFNRLLRPYLISATLLAGMSVYLNHFVLPNANKVRLEFEENYMHHPLVYNNVHREVSPGVIIYFKNNYSGYLDSYCMEKWENNELKSILFAQQAFEDTVNKTWKLRYYFMRTLGEDRDIITRGDEMDTALGFTVSDFGHRVEFASSMTYGELNRFIESERASGSQEVVLYEIEKHQRTAFPLAAYILTLIAVCISGRKVRGGLGFHLSIGLLMAVAYIFSMKMTTVAATNAGLDASIAVWIPNFIFLLLTVPIYLNAQK